MSNKELAVQFFCTINTTLNPNCSSIMPEFDLTISISVIVALCAIISPILTSIINNRYQIKLKCMELSKQEYRDSILYQRNIYENYLKYAGRCIYHADNNAKKDYGEYYYSALMYAPPDIRSDMLEANKLMSENRYDEASVLIEGLTAKIHAIQ
nr:hypothetical protein [uncultured Acetatifactor sp.]